MTSFGTAPLKEIWAMLDECAPGHKVVERPHHYCVFWKERTYPSLPKGRHGKKKGRGEVQVGKIRQLVRQLEIDEDCAKGFIGALQ